MNCPICGSVFIRMPIRTGRPPSKWFWGDCECPRCGTVRVNGIMVKGKRQMIYWHPECPRHGIDPVIAVSRRCNRFLCTVCDQVFEVDRGRLIVTVDPPEPKYLRVGRAG